MCVCGHARRKRPSSGNARTTSPIAPSRIIKTRRGIAGRSSEVSAVINCRRETGIAGTALEVSPAPRSIPIERAALPGVDQADHEDADVNECFAEAKHPERPQLHRPWVEEHYFDVKDEEEQCGQIEPHGVTSPGGAARRIAALEGLALDLSMGRFRADQPVDRDHRTDDQADQPERHGDWKPDL